MHIGVNGMNDAHDYGKKPSLPVRPPWARVRFQTVNEEPSMTQQSHFDQTDVNAIVARFERTGVMPPPMRPGQYADVTGLQGDFTEILNRSEKMILDAQAFAATWKEPAPEEPPELTPAANPVPTPS